MNTSRTSRPGLAMPQDLSAAQTLWQYHRPMPCEIICYHCQQAAEKAIKALFIRFDLPGGIVYIADFVTILPNLQIENVIDAKSAATKMNRVYINKKKQMKACWGIDILEV